MILILKLVLQPLCKKIGCADARVAYHDHLGQDVIFKNAVPRLLQGR